MSDDGRTISPRRENPDESGFTLVELLIVIVVLGILAAVTVLGLSNISGQSLTSACHADVKSVATAQEAFRAQTGSFATNVNALVTAASPGPYLRSPPGNTDKYIIQTDGATGRVTVNNLKTNGGNVSAPGIDGENNTLGTGGTFLDPCQNL